MRPVRVGTRGSPLALAQTDLVVAALRACAPGTSFEAVSMRTHGDEGRGRDLGMTVDMKRAFTKRIDDALLAGHTDLAVHSLKDLPTSLADGLVLAAVPNRETPWDALLGRDGRSLDDLPNDARLGTSSLRRRAQLLAFRPSFRVSELRGNIGTRLRRLDAGEFEGIVLAEAGLRRLGLAGHISQILSPELMVPAVGQGALAVEARADDANMRALASRIDDPAARAATDAEREVARLVGGGCNVPLGALGIPDRGSLRLEAVIASSDGRRVVRARATGSVRARFSLARRVASELLAGGGLEILAEATT